MHLGVVGGEFYCFFQFGKGFCRAVSRGEEDGVITVDDGRVDIPFVGLFEPVFGFLVPGAGFFGGFCPIGSGGVNLSQLHGSAWLVSLMQGGRLQFFHGGIIFIQHVSECPGCLDADDFGRVVEQGDDVGGFRLPENAGGGGSLERIEAVSGCGRFCLHAMVG